MAYIILSPTKGDESYGGAASNTQWDDVTRGRGFVGSGSNTFTVSVTAYPDLDEFNQPVETILWVGIEPSSFTRAEEPDITTSNGASTASVTGRYLNGFSDDIKYMPRNRGYSNGYFTSEATLPDGFDEVLTVNSAITFDYTTTQTEVVGFGNLPSNTNLTYVSGDTSTYITETFSIYVQVGDLSSNPTANQSFSATHDIYNDWEFYILRIAEHRKTLGSYPANTYVFSNSSMEATYGDYYY